MTVTKPAFEINGTILKKYNAKAQETKLYTGQIAKKIIKECEKHYDDMPHLPTKPFKNIDYIETKTMNEITQIKYTEEFFSTVVFKIVERWYTEFNKSGIYTYHKKYNSSKKYDIQKVTVPYKEMKRFFSEIYKFIRTADYTGELVDDCGRTMTIIYSNDHKEIVEGCPMRGEEQMIAMVYSFMEKHGINWF